MLDNFSYINADIIFFNMENVGVFFRFNLIFNFEEIKDPNAINIIYKMSF